MIETRSSREGDRGLSLALAPPSGPMGTPRNGGLSGSATEQLRHFTGWVYAAIRPIAQRIAGQPVRVARVGSGMRRQKSRQNLKPLDSHPFLDLLADPNESMGGWTNVCFSWVANLLLTGEGCLLFDVNGERDELWPLPTSWLTPIHRERPYSHWRIRPNNSATELTVPGEIVARAALPNPADPFEAAGPLQAAAAAVTADEKIQLSQAVAFDNGIHPSVAIIAGDTDANGQPHRVLFDAAQRQQLIQSIRALYSGVLKHGDPVILDGLIHDIKKLSLTPDEMNWLDSGNQTKERILQMFGVNPIILGQVEGVNRASSAIAQQHFCEFTVNPLAELLSETLTSWAGPLYAAAGEKLEIWIEPAVPKDSEELRANIETLAKVGGVTPNEARSLLLGLAPQKGGDVPLVPINLIPQEQSDGE